ncbi:hypothetical protein [Piscinibacter terrae]|uniref:hypothetical protein n=1 Tax=Piscinibacter terrae TaxID=2496871 RepID=UPI000F595D1D|nr:hypothetical protein [Albitalea terrae]
MKTDEICDRYYAKNVGLSIRLLYEQEGEASTTVLVEGVAEALRMLAELLVTVADESENEGFSISPFGAGRAHFSLASTLGIYIRRIDK